MKSSVSIIGLGYLGGPLARELRGMGHPVKGTTRSQEKQQVFLADEIQCEVLDHARAPSTNLLDSDVIVLNIPPFERQLNWFRSWDWDYSKRVIFVSSTSVYQESDSLVGEDSPLQEGILSSEENWIQKNFQDHMILRAGGILGPGRHPGRILSGRKNLSKGHHPVNLIHVDDLRGVITGLIHSEENGVMNVVSDEHHSRKDFYREFCQRNDLPPPEFDEADESLGKTVSNSRLKSFYALKWPTIFGKDP